MNGMMTILISNSLPTLHNCDSISLYFILAGLTARKGTKAPGQVGGDEMTE